MSKWRLEDFLEPVWTGPDDFLTKYKGDFSDLRTFAEALNNFTESLKSNLTTIIHDDYTEFVAISRQLLQLGDHMGSLIKLLRTCERGIADAAKSREAATQLLRTQSESLRKVKHEYAVCSLALEAVENLENIEKRLEEIEEDPYSMVDVAVGFSVTRAKISMLDQPSDRKPIEGDFERLHGQFCDVISRKFCECVKQRDNGAMEILLSAVVVGGIQKVIYDAYAESFLGALIEDVEEHLKATRGVRANCEYVFGRVLEYLNDGNGDLVFIEGSTGDDFDFIEHAFWPRVAAFLDRRLSFPIGNVAEQKKSYVQWNQFVDACERRCKTVEAVVAMRNSIEFRNIRSKLGLNVYAQLISKQICDEAEAIFNDEVKKQQGAFHLSLCPSFVRCYTKLFSDELFIVDQAKDFAVIAMKLIASLSAFAKASSIGLLPYFVVDLPKVGTEIMSVTPEFLQSPMRMAIESLSETAELLKSQILDAIADKCVQDLKYIETMTVVSVQSQKQMNVSPKAAAAIKSYMTWASNEGAVLAGPETLQFVTERLLQAFHEKAEATLRNIKRDLETISKFRKTPGDGKDGSGLSLDGVKKQLKKDCDYIANVVRGEKVAVDEMPIFQQIVQLLELEQK